MPYKWRQIRKKLLTLFHCISSVNCHKSNQINLEQKLLTLYHCISSVNCHKSNPEEDKSSLQWVQVIANLKIHDGGRRHIGLWFQLSVS